MIILKNHGTPNKLAKVRFVAQVYGDNYKPLIVHDTAASRAASIWLILSVACAKQFNSYLMMCHKLVCKENLSFQQKYTFNQKGMTSRLLN